MGLGDKTAKTVSKATTVARGKGKKGGLGDLVKKGVKYAPVVGDFIDTGLNVLDTLGIFGGDKEEETGPTVNYTVQPGPDYLFSDASRADVFESLMGPFYGHLGVDMPKLQRQDDVVAARAMERPTRGYIERPGGKMPKLFYDILHNPEFNQRIEDAGYDVEGFGRESTERFVDQGGMSVQELVEYILKGSPQKQRYWKE